MHYPPAEDGQHRMQLLQVLVGDREVVVAQHDDVAEPADLERAEQVLVLPAEEPSVRAGEVPEDLGPGELLAGVDLVASALMPVVA